MALVITQLTTGSSTSASASTASVTIPNNSVAYVYVGLVGSSSSTGVDTTISSASLSWTNVFKQGYFNGSSRSRAVQCWRAINTSGSDVTETIATSSTVATGTFSGIAWSVEKVTGIDTTTPNGTAQIGSWSSGTITLGSVGTVDTGDVVYGGSSNQTATNGAAYFDGFTGVSDVPQTDVRNLKTCYDTDPQDDTPTNSAGSGGCGAFILNIASSTPTLSLAATEGADSASLTGTDNVSLAVTEGADVGSFTGTDNVSLAVTEGADAAAFTAEYVPPSVTGKGIGTFTGWWAKQARRTKSKFGVLLPRNVSTDQTEVEATVWQDWWLPAGASNSLSLAATEGADSASLTVHVTASLAATEGADTSSATVTVNASLAATEGADVFAGTLADGTVPMALAATEGADSSAGQVNVTASLAVTEGADTSAGTINVTAALVVTEGADVAAFTMEAAGALTLAATEGADSSAATINVTATLAAVEGADTSTASINATASLAVTEGADSFAGAFEASGALSLAATEGADTSAGAINVTVALTVTEGADQAAFTVEGEAIEPPFYPVGDGGGSKFLGKAPPSLNELFRPRELDEELEIESIVTIGTTATPAQVDAAIVKAVAEVLEPPVDTRRDSTEDDEEEELLFLLL